VTGVEFDWDERKAAAKLKKHGVDFADAALILYDDRALTRQDLGNYDEERFVSLGLDPLGRVLVVVYTYRGEGSVPGSFLRVRRRRPNVEGM